MVKSGIRQIAKSWLGGLQVYKPGKPIKEVARELGLQSAESIIIKLASNENPLGPSPLAVKAIKEAASQMHRYPDGSAYYLRNAFSKKLNVKPGQILIANGGNEVLEFIGKMFLEPGTEMLMAEYSFSVYRLIADLFQARTVSVPMKNYTHDLDATLAAITPRTKVVFIANPNNPTGTMVSETDIDRFMKHLPGHVVVCFDEAYVELLPVAIQPDTLKHVREERNVIILRSFSKSYGLAGLRIGYAIASEECIALMNRVRQPFNVNAMALVAALAALDDESHLCKTRKLIQKELSFLTEQFSRLGLSYVPSVANFILVDVEDGRTVFEALQKEGIIVRPMDACGLPHHVRITVGTRTENKRCISALSRMLGTLPADYFNKAGLKKKSSKE